MPLNSSRLTKAVCHTLLDSINSNLTHWSTKFLSYSGKLQLINSVIFGSLNFWCSSFLLPSTLLKEVEAICKRFFWNFGSQDRKLIFFGWDRVCKPKEEGGFNVKEALSWNKVLLCKWIVKLENGTGIWAKWASSYYVKNADFWSIPSKSTDSWAWKGYLKIRDHLSPNASGRSAAAFLLDSWCVNGKLLLTKAYDFFRSKKTHCNWHFITWGRM